jgi:hypothetical protein
LSSWASAPAISPAAASRKVWRSSSLVRRCSSTTPPMKKPMSAITTASICSSATVTALKSSSWTAAITPTCSRVADTIAPAMPCRAEAQTMGRKRK